MSALYGWLSGQSGNTVTRRGSKNSGIHLTASGWGVGIKVRGYINEAGEEVFDVWKTDGSRSGNSATEHIATIKKGE